ncbi:hypothetical protein [Allohahella sp. A8]
MTKLRDTLYTVALFGTIAGLVIWGCIADRFRKVEQDEEDDE